MSYGTIILILIISTIILLPATWIILKKVYDNDELFNKSKNARIFVHMFVFLGYTIPGSIVSACLSALVVSEMFGKIEGFLDIVILVILAILVVMVQICNSMLITLFFGIHELETYWKDKKKKRYITYFVLAIIASICWTIPLVTYDANVETKYHTTIENIEQIELVEFCGIPVEKLSKGGDIQDIDESQIANSVFSNSFKYYYLNDDGEKESKTVEDEDFVMCFKEDIESPYLEIRTYKKEQIIVDNNKGSERVLETNKFKKYIFYLPEETFDTLLSKG